MTELRQTGFNETPREQAIAAPNEPHIACVLLLDTSGSMTGAPIASLNKAVNDFKTQTVADELAQKRVDISIIEFNDTARVVQDFVPLTEMEPVTLTAGGCTAMGEGIELAIDKVKERNRLYASLGTPCFKPWIFMITDGMPTDDITAARNRIELEESKGQFGKLKFWAVGVNGYDKATLTSLTKRCIELSSADFSGIFNWLSESMVTISVSNIGGNPQLTDLPSNARVIPTDW